MILRAARRLFLFCGGVIDIFDECHEGFVNNTRRYDCHYSDMRQERCGVIIRLILQPDVTSRNITKHFKVI